MEENIYTLEINKLDPTDQVVKSPDSEFFGKSMLVLKGSFTVVEDPKFSGRKLWDDFRPQYKFAQVALKKLMTASGVSQAPGESLRDWGAQFATLNPPARIQVQVQKVADRRDPTGPPVNRINYYSAKPAN